MLCFGGCLVGLFHVLGAKLSRIPIAALGGFIIMLGWLHGLDLNRYTWSFNWLVEFLKQHIRVVISGLILTSAVLLLWLGLRAKLPTHLYRAIFHMSFGLILLQFIWWDHNLGFLTICFSLMMFGCMFLVWDLPGAGSKFSRSLKELLRSASINGEQEICLAMFFYLLGAWLATIMLPHRIAIAAIGVLGFADPAARVAGVCLRIPKLRYNPQKTLPGSLAMFGISLSYLLVLVNPIQALLAASSVAIFESLPVKVSDNLVIPLICGMVLGS